ncbi:hypothetical protein SH591_02440 [Sphingomonas sp. LY54]|uniref:hypothetical protein n=1 Tax=Sphingomonas sp. LY54 TaxID=3095343 RepID=UPI002D776F65|nr:hypothetical protein [Sphingomonas sp. LY54]WRP29060.1 hypothetical protein SH591_02440 [Sphingomonas sp. LY54]
MRNLTIAIALACSLAATAQAAAPQRPEPLITREADGSVLISRDIRSEEPRLSIDVATLLDDRDPRLAYDFSRSPSERETLSGTGIEDDAREAFEEAIDQARSARSF